MIDFGKAFQRMAQKGNQNIYRFISTTNLSRKIYTSQNSKFIILPSICPSQAILTELFSYTEYPSFKQTWSLSALPCEK